MAVTPINSEDRLVQAPFAEHLEQAQPGRPGCWAGTASMPGTRRRSGLTARLAVLIPSTWC